MRPATLARSTFALALFLAGTGWMSSARAQSLSAGPMLEAPVYAGERGGDEITLTQSKADFIEAGGVSCGATDGTHTTENSFFRAFDLSEIPDDTGDITVTSVDMAVGPMKLNGNDPISTTIRFHSVSALNPDGSFQLSDATLLGEQEFVVSDAIASTLVNIPITADITLAQDGIFAFEWFTPSGNPLDSGLETYFDIRYGANASDETRPTLLASASCGLFDPATLESLGNPDLDDFHWVLFINGTLQTSGGGPELVLNPAEITATVVTGETTTVNLDVSNTGDTDLTFSFSGIRGADVVESVTPESGTVTASISESVAVVLSGEGLAPGTYPDQITLTTNDVDEGVVSIPVTLEVTEVPGISFNPNPLVEMLDTDMTGVEVLAVTNNTDGPVVLDFSQYSGAARPAPTPQRYPHLELGKNEQDPRLGETPLRGSGGPDAFGYQWIDSNEPDGPTFDFVDISGTGTPLNLDDDDGTFVPLPFTFSFYGEDQTQVGISSNGYLTFDDTDVTPSAFSNDPIGDSATPNDLIAPFWDDLDPGDDVGQIYWEDLEDGRFVVQWDDVPHFPGPGSGSNYTFQAILNANGSILFQYLSMDDVLGSASIGIENADASVSLEVVSNAPYVEDNLAVLLQARPTFVTDMTPSMGTLPSGATAMVSVSFDASGLNGGTYSGSLVLDTDIADGESTFELPVLLTVTGESDCAIDPNPIDFGDLIVGESSTIEVAVVNTGTDTCTLTDATFGEGVFTADFNGPVDVAPDDDATISITFTPDAVGSVASALTVTVQDDDDLTANVQGSGLAPADFSVDFDEMEFTVAAGEASDAQTITLSNDGDGTGTYSVSAIVVTKRPGTPTREPSAGPFERQSEIVAGYAPTPQASAPSRGGDVVEDGSFESATLPADPADDANPFWVEFSSNFGTPLCNEATCNLGGGSGPFDGSIWTWFGGVAGFDELGSLEQDVTIPAGIAVLSFWHEIPAVGTTGFMSVTIDGDEVFRSTEADGDTYGVYAQVMIDISAYADGETHTLRFESMTDAGAGATNFFVDLVEITSAAGLLMAVDPESGTVESNDSVAISVTANATNADPGEYAAEVLFTTDDPDNRTITVPMTIAVVATPSTEEEGLPAEFALGQNYPNPFADATTIEYALPEAARVTVTVFDAVGRRVATLVDEDRTAGYHEAQWVTRGLASGIYFYRIDAGPFNRTMKMSLVR